MIYKNGALHPMCVKCKEDLIPTREECEFCEHDFRNEYADYPGDCRGIMEDEE